jgi:hypothetical protein
MNRRLWMIFCFAATLFGCGHHQPWRVVTETAPDPFVNQTLFALAHLTCNGGLVDGTPCHDQSGPAEMLVLNAGFAMGLMNAASDAGIRVVPANGPASAPFTIVPRVSLLERPEDPLLLGNLAKGKIEMYVAIRAPTGQVLDEIFLNVSLKVGVGHDVRYSAGGEALGKQAAMYVKSRVVQGP